MRLKIGLDGDLARALAWEADRRGVQVDRLAQSLVERSVSRILVSWRKAHRGVHIFAGRPGRSEVRSFESVLKKAYGPPKPQGRRLRSMES